MNEYDIKRLAFILAVQAEIEGMKSTNEMLKIQGKEPCYIGYDFNRKAKEIMNLAHKHNDQL